MKDITIDTGMKSLIPLSPPQGKHSLKAGGTFQEVLKRSIGEVNRLQHEADASIEHVVAGRANNLHETMIAMEKADISFRLMMEVRNKLIEAYHEIMRMQV